MAYADQADMEARFSTDDLIGLTDRGTPPAGAIDTAVLNAALDDATGEMNSYLGRRYAVPLASIPNDVKIKCVMIAYYRLHRDSVPEKVRKDYEDALRWLRDVSTGVVVLDVDLAPAPAGSSDGAEIEAPDRIFATDKMGGF